MVVVVAVLGEVGVRLGGTVVGELVIVVGGVTAVV